MPRSRTFDDDALLDAAIELFWVHGYKSASLAALTAGTGVTNGSIYQAYGSKRELFLAAFRRYCERRVAIVSGVFETGHPDLEGTVNAYFDAIVDDCISYPDRRGCLMLNTISELGTDAEVSAISTQTVDAMEGAVARALADVAPRDTEPAAIVLCAAQIVALSQALIQLSRMGRDADDLRRIGGQTAASTRSYLQPA